MSVMPFIAGLLLVTLGVILLVLNAPVTLRYRRRYPLDGLLDGDIQGGTRTLQRWGRYPDPSTVRGAAETATSLRCATYARMARERAQYLELIAEMVILVCSAGLGTTIASNNNGTIAWVLGAVVGLAFRTILATHWRRIAQVYDERAAALRALTPARSPSPAPGGGPTPTSP